MNKKRRYNFSKSDQKMIYCDLDGTLLNSDGGISQFTIDTIKSVVKHGHKFCLITGRPYNGSIDTYNKLELDTIMVNQNGSYITNPSNPNFIPIAIGFNNEIVKEILNNEILKKYTNNALIEGINKSWLWRDTTDKTSMYKMMETFHLKDRDVEIICEDHSKINTDISAILLHVDDLSHLNLFIYEIKNISPTLIVRSWSLYSSEGVIIEINTQFASKKMAAKFISSYYGIPKEQCVSFGDGDNDVDMLSWTTWSFATKNANPAAILAARYMTKNSNNEDAVASELLKFLEIDD